MSPSRSPRAVGVFPGLDQFGGYRPEWMRSDVLAGAVVGAYLVPEVMAYAQLAGVSPAAGLWIAVVASAGYALLGSSACSPPAQTRAPHS